MKPGQTGAHAIPPGMTVRTMDAADHPSLLELWKRAGFLPRPAVDDLAAVALFLDQNPEVSLVAEQEGRIIGALLCGEDGRGAFIHRVAADAGAGESVVISEMVRRCLLKLRSLGLSRCYLLGEPGQVAVEIGRGASSGLGEAVQILVEGACQQAARRPSNPVAEPGLTCELIKPRSKK